MPTLIDDLLPGVVDCYVHCAPDLLPRLGGDLELAVGCRGAGYRVAVHRHHFASTVERCAVASQATGFALLGAVLLNDSLGGVNPWAVEVALRHGGRWVGLPTLSAAFFREGLGSMPERVRDTLGLGPGRLRLIDAAGALTDDAHAVLRLCREADVPLNTGYCSPAECRALITEARAVGHGRIVMTNPHSSMRQSPNELIELCEGGGVHVELTAYSLHGGGPGRRHPGRALDAALEVIERVGADRCILSSDGGMDDAPAPHELLRSVMAALQASGLPVGTIDALVRANPARLIGL